jgi:hypothetical protein
MVSRNPWPSVISMKMLVVRGGGSSENGSVFSGVSGWGV